MHRGLPLHGNRLFLITGLIVSLLAIIALRTEVQAQGFEQDRQFDRYRYLPRLPEGNENPPPLPDSPSEVTGSDKLLVKELKALVFVDHPSKVQPGKIAAAGISVDGNLNLPKSAAFHQVVGTYIGGEVSIYRLNRMIRDIILFYRNHNQPVVDVSIPDQDITDGVVQVVITEARVGKVFVKGPCFFDPRDLVDQVYISPGNRIYESNLLADQRWLMRNPFRRVDLELSPGDSPGETDVIFNVTDRRPVRTYAGYEDTGNTVTGLERLFAGVNWYNAFNKDDQFGYQYTVSPDFAQVGIHSAIYSLALYNRDIISFFGTYGTVDTPAGIFNPFDNEGTFWQASMRWNRELCPRGCYNHGIQAGFDYKNTNTALDFGGVFVAGSDADIVQFMIGYNGNKYDCFGSMHVGVDLYMSPGNWGGKNGDADYQAIIPFAESTYIYSRAFFERRYWLGYGELVGRITGQLASTNLLPPETIGLGGFNSIRGYSQYTFAGDSGYFANLEWWTHPLRCLWGDDELRALVFYDFGEAWQHTAFTGIPSNVTLNSVGAGLRYKLNNRFELRADYGWQLSSPVGFPQPDSRFHIGAVLSH